MSLQVPKPTWPPAQSPSARVSITAMTRPPPPQGSRPSLPFPRPMSPLVSKIPAGLTQKLVPPSISILDKLIKTCPVWLQLGMAHKRAIHILNREPPGIFLVRRESDQKSMVLSLRLPDLQGEPQFQEFLVKEEKALLHLEGSALVFDNIFKLIAFYCASRDILPFTLELPQAIVQATKYEDIEVISTLGLEFWGSTLNSDRTNQDAAGHMSPCEMQLSADSGRLWYVSPIFIEEYCNSLLTSPPAPILRTQSLNTPLHVSPRYKRPPPLPPRPFSVSEGPWAQASPKSAREQLTSEESMLLQLSTPAGLEKEEGSQPVCAEDKGTQALTERLKPYLAQQPTNEAIKQTIVASSHSILSVSLRQKPSENLPPGEEIQQNISESNINTAVPAETEKKISAVPVVSLVCLDNNIMEECTRPMDPSGQPESLHEKVLVKHDMILNGVPTVTTSTSTEFKKPDAPVPPPRRKRLSQAVAGDPLRRATEDLSTLTLETSTCQSVSVNADSAKATDVSLFSPEGGALQPDHDSYSTSSTEDDTENASRGGIVKRTSTIMLDRAKQRLSMVNFSTVFTSFMNADRKLQKRIVELARDGSTYFGNLVRDYRSYTLDTMQKHTSSTEMLQEIRQMMTQLKGYLIQSTELQNLQEAAIYSEEKMEIIIEAALCKSVLKPLREAIYNGLKNIHLHLDTLKRLRENQQVVLGTTSTDLGVTTSVPDTPIMEKIQVKLGHLHLEYSPQKKIDLLLKTCKIIYESMSVGSPGKPHGADDFLPVLMYVLPRCNMTALFLDVEYMMELMDPALQLGEGSYYLTTTYGALEHIKNYDKQAMTRQLSLEVQDSIHRWERRRTLNKVRASRSSIQDFINVSFLEAGSNTKTLGVRPNTTAQDLCTQCAVKFEVLEPNSYCLSVLVDGHYCPLRPEEFPLTIKASLLHSEPRKEYYFVYRHGRWPGHESDNQPLSNPVPSSIQEESLI